MSIKIGLTGGLASGKTTVTNFLKRKNFLVHDSDFVVKKLYSKPSPTFLTYLKKINFSKSIKNKKINKNIIREEIFSNKIKKNKLEKFIHNEVRKDRDRFIKKNKKTKVLFFDIPLLFEANLSHTCDYIILLYAPKDTRIKRAVLKKGIVKKIVLKILDNQLGDNYKKKRSDFVINTSKSKTHCFKMILEAIDIIINKNA